MARGGTRAGAGRPEGSRNRRTVEVERKAAENAAVIEAILPGAFAGDAHAYLMSVYKDRDASPEHRLDAAKAAIRFERPALASIEVQSEGTVRHVISGEPLSPEERDREWIERHGLN